MARQSAYRLIHIVILCVLIIVSLGADAAPAFAREAPPEGPAGPHSAPVAPEIGIARVPNTNNAELSWLHVVESSTYQVWRGTTPYFDPTLGQGNQIKSIPAEPYGSGSIVEYTDDGVDRYAGDGTLPTVQIIGVPATNYFWVARGQNGEGVSANSNRVGEFDFALETGS